MRRSTSPDVIGVLLTTATTDVAACAMPAGAAMIAATASATPAVMDRTRDCLPILPVPLSKPVSRPPVLHTAIRARGVGGKPLPRMCIIHTAKR